MYTIFFSMKGVILQIPFQEQEHINSDFYTKKYSQLLLLASGRAAFEQTCKG